MVVSNATETNERPRLRQHLLIVSLIVVGLFSCGAGVAIQVSTPEIDGRPLALMIIFVILHLLAIWLGTYKKKYAVTVVSHGWRSKTRQFLRYGDRWLTQMDRVLDGDDNNSHYFVPEQMPPNTVFENLYTERWLLIDDPNRVEEPRQITLTNAQFWQEVNDGSQLQAVVDVFGNYIRLELHD